MGERDEVRVVSQSGESGFESSGFRLGRRSGVVQTERTGGCLVLSYVSGVSVERASRQVDRCSWEMCPDLPPMSSRVLWVLYVVL